MRISENITIYAGMEPQTAPSGEQQEKTDGNRIFAGNLNKTFFVDKIARRREQAQKQAMKVVSDVWEGERAIDEDMEKRRARIDELRKEMKYAKSQLQQIDETQKQLQEEYGVAPDSQEQKDLELLRRKNDMLSGRPGAGLTQEEFMYAAKLEAQGLTEYQQRQLDLDREKKIYQESYDEAFKGIRMEIATISATKLERLKHDPMVAAWKQADEILAQAGEEVLGMLVEESKEHLDQEQEAREEQAESLREERRKQEAFLQAQKEKKQESEALIEEMPAEEMLTLEQVKTDVQQEIQNIVDRMKLVAEDIKGAVVDQSV